MPLPAANAAIVRALESLGSNTNRPFGGATSIGSPTFNSELAKEEKLPLATAFTATFKIPLLGDEQME